MLKYLRWTVGIKPADVKRLAANFCHILFAAVFAFASSATFASFPQPPGQAGITAGNGPCSATAAASCTAVPPPNIAGTHYGVWDGSSCTWGQGVIVYGSYACTMSAPIPAGSTCSGGICTCYAPYTQSESNTCVIGNPEPPRKIVAIDPGHGFLCVSKGMPPGAIGVTDFPPSNPPPGWLQEDELTMAIAREFQRMASSKYTVVLTKNSANTCPKYEERGGTAIDAKADVFVSVHINRRNPIPSNPFANGTSAVYNSSRPAAAKNLAELMAASVSASLGVNNRGAMVDDRLAVLKKAVTPKMTAVLVEAARLSGSDEEKLHAGDSATKVAAGIKAALDAFFGN